MKLYAVIDKNGDVMIAYPATQFHNQSCINLKELHTYDPATHVVVDIDRFEQLQSQVKELVTENKRLGGMVKEMSGYIAGYGKPMQFHSFD